jgi:hypothetical protein
MLAVGKALASVRDRGTWMQLALLTDTRDVIEGHWRLLRALDFGDDDYEGAVYQVLPSVLGDIVLHGMEPPPFGKPLHAAERFKHLDTVSNYLRVPDWLAENDPALAAQVLADDQADSLLPDGTVLNAVEATAGRLGVEEMRRQVERIRRDHGEDSEALVGHVKELVESTCKTILGLTGDNDTQDDVPALVHKTLKHLGLHPEDVEASGGDVVEARALKRLFGGLSNVLQGAAELRNRRGAGHGRSGAPLVDDALARLTAGMVMSAVVYLGEIYENRLAVSTSTPDGPALQLPIKGDRFVVGSIVEHRTFGEGQLISWRETDSGPMIEVIFDDHGRKKLLLHMAPLRLVRNPPGV